MTTVYGSSFYDDQADGSQRSAREVVPYVLELTRVRSVVDVGCGVGTWLRSYADQGIVDYLGLDGAWVDVERLLVPPDRFQPTDLSNPPAVSRRFDLAQSLEVAEHIEESRSGAFVEFLTSLADIVVFSAAVPYQGGTHHVNEQWPGYWEALFHQRGFVLYDVFRPRLWLNSTVEWWYSQNMFMYIKQGSNPALTERVISRLGWVYPERIVHPDRVDPRRQKPPRMRHLLRLLAETFAHKVTTW
jgi:SAM-dependent methyltransferase